MGLIYSHTFSRGGSALPLVERLSVAETKWLTPQDFAVGVGFAYATPGPILILAPFIGYRVGGLLGALVATIAVFLIPILQHTRGGEVCYEPFAGSGTQIIAAERTGRACYAMEIDPYYCDLCVRRYIAFVGAQNVSRALARRFATGAAPAIAKRDQKRLALAVTR